MEPPDLEFVNMVLHRRQARTDATLRRKTQEPDKKSVNGFGIIMDVTCALVTVHCFGGTVVEHGMHGVLPTTRSEIKRLT